MGLDGFELILAVEETFDIKVDAEAAEHAITVGDLYEVIVESADKAHQNRCLSAKVFRSIRQHAHQLGVQGRIRPSTLLEEVFPSVKKVRKQFWSELSRETGFRLPRLVLSTQAGAASLALVLVSSLTLTILVASFNLEGALMVFFVTSLLFGSLVLHQNSRYETEFHSSFSTFRALTEYVMANNGAKLREMYGPFSPTETWAILQTIVADVLGVDKKFVTKDAKFVEDLGME